MKRGFKKPRKLQPVLKFGFVGPRSMSPSSRFCFRSCVMVMRSACRSSSAFKCLVHGEGQGPCGAAWVPDLDKKPRYSPPSLPSRQGLRSLVSRPRSSYTSAASTSMSPANSKPIPPPWLEIPKWPWKDSGWGWASSLVRAFADSKPHVRTVRSPHLCSYCTGPGLIRP